MTLPVRHAPPEEGKAPAREKLLNLVKLIELFDNPSCIISTSGNIKVINFAWRSYAGIDKTTDRLDLVGLVDVDFRYAAMALCKNLSSSLGRTDFECRLREGNGASRWFKLTLQAAPNDAEDDLWLCTCVDIERLKRRELELEERDRLQADMLNISSDCIKLIARSGSLIYMNRAGCRALGVPEDSPFGMEWLGLLPEDVRPIGEQALATARDGSPARFTGQSALLRYSTQIWDNVLMPIKGGDGRAISILCVSRDITAEREAQDALRQSQERLVVAARVGGLGIWDYDIELDALECDETWYHIMGRDPMQPVRCIADFRPFIHPEDVEHATEVHQTAAQLIDRDRDYAVIFRIVRPDGGIRWVRSAACVIQDLHGRPKRAVGFLVDVTDAMRGEMALRNANRLLEAERDTLTQQCMEDSLTGIANRRYLDSELVRACLQANRRREIVAACMIDVDHFKTYNDRYGHQAGDGVLRRVATVLSHIARRSDFVARYGGEEFMLLLPATDPLAPLLERLVGQIKALGVPHAASPYGTVTVSCGCAVLRSNGDLSPAMLIEAADKALYQAKSLGRNRYVIQSYL